MASFLLPLSPSLAADEAPINPPSIDGSYKGMMFLRDGEVLDIPLSIVLTITDEVEKIEVSPGVFEMQKVINGNFLIDREGGPFAFSKITYRFKTGEIDMSYKRTKGVTVGQPSTYELVGKVAADGGLSGRILSGNKGQIGTFKLAKTALAPLVSRPEYVGVWVGTVKLIPEGDIERIGITIAPTGFATLNPEQFEFDYTLGKISHMDFSVAQMALPNVAIDYLHHRVFLTGHKATSGSAQAGVTVDAVLDFETNHLVGTFSCSTAVPVAISI